MNIPIYSSTGKQFNLCLRLVSTKLIVRSTSKIAVEVSKDLEDKLNAKDVKPRQHPGIIKVSSIELPAHINRALHRVIGDYPVKTLLNDCRKLNQYINSRHPPIEQEQARDKMKIIAEEVDSVVATKLTNFVSKEESEKLLLKREQAIRRIFNKRTYAWKPITYGAYETIVYAIGRSALEYAVLARILKEIMLRDPQFKPRSYFDFGSGVGSGMWAASSFWKESIFEYFNVDSSRDMNDLSELILREGNENQQISLRNVFYRQFLPNLEVKYDLILSAYSLFELPSRQERQQVLLNLWEKCDGYLVIVEEGTRRGCELINEARDLIVKLKDDKLKGHVFSPCPHNLACPRLAAVDDRSPCNFEAPYTPFSIGDLNCQHLLARYSYIVLKKGNIQDSTQHWPRLVRPTLVRSGHAICRMCTAGGKLQEIIFTKSKHGKNAHLCARSSKWGDRLPVVVGDRFEIYTKTDKILLRKREECNSDEKL